MFPKSPEDYKLETLSKTDGFKIYPPVNADFKFQTLEEDPNRKVQYIDGEKYLRLYCYPYPEDDHSIKPKLPLRGGINSPPTQDKLIMNQFKKKKHMSKPKMLFCYRFWILKLRPRRRWWR
jgi:hypothetical protein